MQRLVLSLILLILLAPGAALAGGDPSPGSEIQKAMSFTMVRSSEKGCEPDCPEWLMAEGMITPGTPLEFRKALDRLAGRKLPVVLMSLGGNMVAAVEIGYMVRRAGLSTAVGKTRYKGCRPAQPACAPPPAQNGVFRGRVVSAGSYCVSACPLILAAGVTRLASPRAVVAVHQIRSYQARDESKAQAAKSDAILDIDNLKLSKGTPELQAFIHNILSGYLTTMGVSLALMDDMQKASGDDIYRLPPKRRLALKLVTGKGGAETLTAKRQP